MKPYLFVLLLLLPSLAWGQRNAVYLSASMAGNTSVRYASDANVKGDAGVLPQLGVGYQFHRKNFLLNVGVEATYLYQWQFLSDLDFPADAIDSEGEPYVRHERRIKRQNNNRSLSLQVPLLLGGQWAGTYFLVGPVYSLLCSGWSREQGIISITGTPAYYLGEYHDMPEHGFTTGEKYTAQDQRLSSFSDVLLHAEVGQQVFPDPLSDESPAFRKHVAVTVGAYVEYSLLQIPSCSNVNVGVRLRVLFDLPAPHRCLCYE